MSTLAPSKTMMSPSFGTTFATTAPKEPSVSPMDYVLYLFFVVYVEALSVKQKSTVARCALIENLSKEQEKLANVQIEIVDPPVPHDATADEIARIQQLCQANYTLKAFYQNHEVNLRQANQSQITLANSGVSATEQDCSVLASFLSWLKSMVDMIVRMTQSTH